MSLSEWVIASLTVVLVAATLWYAWTTQHALDASRDAVAEAKRANDLAEQARRDQLGALFEMKGHAASSGGPSLNIIYTNVGPTAAFDVEVTLITPDGQEVAGNSGRRPRIAGRDLGYADGDESFSIARMPRAGETYAFRISFRDRFGPRTQQFAVTWS